MFKKKVIQTHHLSYDPEVTGKVYREEHYYLSMIDRFKSARSVGFLRSLKWFILRHEKNAINLDTDKKEDMGFHTKNIKNKKKKHSKLARKLKEGMHCFECGHLLMYRKKRWRCAGCGIKITEKEREELC